MYTSCALVSATAATAILAPYLVDKDPKRYLGRWEMSVLTLLLGIITAIGVGPLGLPVPLVYFGWLLCLILINDKALPRDLGSAVSAGLKHLFDTTIAGFKYLFDTTIPGISVFVKGIARVYTDISRIPLALYASCGDFYVSIAGGAKLFWSAILELTGAIQGAAKAVWPHCTVENSTRLIFAVAFLAYAPRIAETAKQFLDHFTGAAIAVQYGKGPVPPPPPLMR